MFCSPLLKTANPLRCLFMLLQPTLEFCSDCMKLQHAYQRSLVHYVYKILTSAHLFLLWNMHTRQGLFTMFIKYIRYCHTHMLNVQQPLDKQVHKYPFLYHSAKPTHWSCPRRFKTQTLPQREPEPTNLGLSEKVNVFLKLRQEGEMSQSWKLHLRKGQ